MEVEIKPPVKKKLPPKQPNPFMSKNENFMRLFEFKISGSTNQLVDELDLKAINQREEAHNKPGAATRSQIQDVIEKIGLAQKTVNEVCQKNKRKIREESKI